MRNGDRSPLDSHDPFVRQAIDIYIAWMQIAKNHKRDTTYAEALAQHLAAVQVAQAAGIMIWEIRNDPEQEKDNAGRAISVDHYDAFGYERRKNR
ncbi:MAG: hypothetical protein J2P36_13450 [Ktedonobacteraceae bacterium]|nr:hypothetical protein [Ktedonobacteraceae bacterium]